MRIPFLGGIGVLELIIVLMVVALIVSTIVLLTRGRSKQSVPKNPASPSPEGGAVSPTEPLVSQNEGNHVERYPSDPNALDNDVAVEASSNATPQESADAQDSAAVDEKPEVTAKAAGWYPDPDGAKFKRWWDGVQWTNLINTIGKYTAGPSYPDPVGNFPLDDIPVLRDWKPAPVFSFLGFIANLLAGAILSQLFILWIPMGFLFLSLWESSTQYSSSMQLSYTAPISRVSPFSSQARRYRF